MSEQAATYMDLIAECPNCGKHNVVKWCEEGENVLEEWQCETCNTDFTYCHPGNHYGLAI